MVVWDMLGLETLFNLTEWEKKTTWAILKDEPKPNSPNLNAILLRAKINIHRKYEIYIFSSIELTEESIRDCFDNNPQFIVDFIRKNGNKIYSDYSTTNQVIF